MVYVPLTKIRRYNEHPQTSLSTFVAPPVTPVNVLHMPNPAVTTSTFLRARAQFTFNVRVDPSDPPPEQWWPACQITFIAAWTNSTSSALPNAVGGSEHYLGSQVLVPRVTPPLVTPNEYVVQFNQTEDLVLDTSRADPSVVDSSVNFGIVVFDPFSALSGLYAGVLINLDCRAFVLWGTRP